MQPAGRNEQVIAHWREAGEWWSGEPYREVRRTLDSRGIRHEEERELPCVGGEKQSSLLDAYTEDQSEEWSLKKHKLRDEKIASAPGQMIPNYESYRSSNRWDKKRAAFVSDRRGLWGERLENPALQHSNTPTLSPLPSPLSSTYVPLHVASGYAFGRGCMLADEIPILAAHAGLPAVAITDPFSLTGAVEVCRQAKKSGVKPLVGATFEMAEGGELVLIAKTKKGYENLSKLITACHLEEPRLFPLCNWERLERFAQDLICLTGGDNGPLNRLLTKKQYKQTQCVAEQIINIFGRENVFIEIERSCLPWEISVNELLLQL